MKTREQMQSALDRLKIAYTPLREDADYESERVKVSTIESAKGHEFGDVFIMGLVEGCCLSPAWRKARFPGKRPGCMWR